ncbi:MAG: cation-transporting P-type ATPase [Patescibacteria group bacterium]
MKEKNLTTGLTSVEAASLLKKFGLNLIQEKRRTPLILQFFAQFKDLLVIILIVAAAFAYIAGEKIDGSIIIGIVILNASIGFIQGYKAEKAISALKKLLSPKARVKRDGTEILIDATQLVPGDIIILNEGDKIPADGHILEDHDIRVDEAILTGESVPVRKDSQKNKKIFMGTQVTHGNGQAVVMQTGMHTEFGKIARLTSETEKDKSPLQKELIHLGVFVGKITLVLSLVLFLIGFFIQGRELIDTILFAVAVAVAAVPEGLPATITVALALGVQRLAKENAIVKQLSSVETLGSTTVICSDKTGTLTKNEMTVQEIFLGDYDVTVRGIGYEPKGGFSVHHSGAKEKVSPTSGRGSIGLASPRLGLLEYFEFDHENQKKLTKEQPAFYQHLELAMTTNILNNNAKLVNKDDTWSILGDPTEGALLTAAEKAGFVTEEIHKKYERIQEIPFDAGRKRMSLVVKERATGEVLAFTKGAPDGLLPLCSHMMKGDKMVPLDATLREELLKRTDLMANRALRTIAVAYKKISVPNKKHYEEKEIESNLIFLGVMAMIDPPREEVKEAIKLTHKAGIRVFIITGDHGLTAHAIAKELGLVKSFGVHILTGEMLDKISDEKLLDFVAKGQETIFARVSPEHKLRIVDTLKRAGEVVAVTGDGVNDAPSLARADIGIAMGITGTDVSKEAANMVLADDSFKTIVTAIIEGRTIYENMRKFIFFIFSSNIGELIAIFSTILLALPAPLTAVLILMINTLTDVFPSLALSVEPVHKDILERPPRKTNVRIMEGAFVRRFMLSGLWIGLTTAAVFVGNLIANGWSFGGNVDIESTLYFESATMAFVVLTLLQMVHVFNSRSETISVFKMKFFENPSLLAAISFSIGATVAIVQIPFFHTYFKTMALTWSQWGVLAIISFSMLFVEEVRKFFQRNYATARISS